MLDCGGSLSGIRLNVTVEFVRNELGLYNFFEFFKSGYIAKRDFLWIANWFITHASSPVKALVQQRFLQCRKRGELLLVDGGEALGFNGSHLK